MALFHLSVTQTKRSAGQSAIASAAYRAGERLYSEYYGEYSDYTRKGGVICSDILLPSHAAFTFAVSQFGKQLVVIESRLDLKLNRRKHIGFEFVLPRIVRRTEIAALDG